MNVTLGHTEMVEDTEVLKVTLGDVLSEKEGVLVKHSVGDEL